jgi:hypothetical protein
MAHGESFIGEVGSHPFLIVVALHIVLNYEVDKIN